MVSRGEVARQYAHGYDAAGCKFICGRQPSNSAGVGTNLSRMGHVELGDLANSFLWPRILSRCVISVLSLWTLV